MNRILLRAACISTFLSIFTFTLASHAEDDLTQGWKQTKLGYKILRSFIDDTGAPNQYPCYANSTNLVGCLHLINSLGSNLKPIQALMTNDLLKLYPGIQYKMIKDYSVVQLVEVDSYGPKQTSIAAAAGLMKQREILLRAAAEQLLQQPKHPVDFDSLSFRLIDQMPESVVRQQAIAFALNEMITVHDGHGHLDALSYLKEQEVNGDKTIVGIGATLNGSSDNPTVMNVIRGSPAEKYGIKKGDVILTVDDHDVKGVRLDQVVRWIRGQKGTPVKIGVLRNEAPLTDPVTIVRDQVNIPNVEVSLVDDMEIKLLYVKLNNFMDRTACEKIQTAVQHLTPDVRGIVFDVRNNPGGLLEEAVCVGGIFVGTKPIAYVRPVKDGKTEGTAYPEVSDLEQQTRLPLVVLIDNMSASASEILAGAIQDYKRGWLVGMRTFGKATVQAPRPLEMDPSIVFFQTVARFYEPSGRTSQIVGISPDFETYAIPNPTDAEKYAPREEDLTPAALAPEGKAWVQTRQASINQIEANCLRPHHRAEDLFKVKADAKEDVDFQLLKAEEVLTCDPRVAAVSL